MTLRLEDGPEGLRVAYPRAVLERAAREVEARRATPAETAPTDGALREAVSAVDLVEALSFARPLARRLENATVLEAGPAGESEAPSRLLVLKGDPALSKAEREHVKKTALTLKLWVGLDGLPTAMESLLEVKAGFLFLNVTKRERERWELARAGDRLIATHHRQETSASGLGRDFLHRVVTTRIRLEDPSRDGHGDRGDQSGAAPDGG